MGQPRHQIPVSFYPSNIKAVKIVAEENRGSVFGNPQHRESRRQGSGVEFQEGGERERADYITSALLLPLDQASRAALSSGWPKGKKTTKRDAIL